jgi:hypothetical protein
VDPIFADGAAKLRSRAAPSARIEPPKNLFLTEHKLARQVLIWGLLVDLIFADGAANLRSRAAPSARIEPCS